jgi:hypothetical protein
MLKDELCGVPKSVMFPDTRTMRTACLFQCSRDSQVELEGQGYILRYSREVWTL